MAQLDTIPCTWKSKINVSDAVVFGGDLAATGAAPASWSSGAQSIQRVAALSSGDYLEIDFTVDTRTAGHGLAVGFAPQYLAPQAPTVGSMTAAIVWDVDNSLKAYELGTLKNSQAGLTLPMSCRIIYNAGVLTWRRNSGSDILFFTSLRTVDQLVKEMKDGLQVLVFFFNTSYKIHLTLKGGDASTPEVGLVGAGTGRLGLPILDAQGLDMTSYNRAMFRSLSAEGFPPPNPHPRPTEGKIWPRKH